MGHAHPSTVSSRDTYLQDGQHEMHRIYMDGKGVYRFATRIIGDSIRDALDQAGLTPDDLTLVIPHQANQRIISTRQGAEIPRNGFTATSNAMEHVCRIDPAGTGRGSRVRAAQPGDIVAFVGFGGGLTWASMIVEWSAAPGRPTRSLTWGRRQGEYALAWLRRPLVRFWRRLMLLSPQAIARRMRERAAQARDGLPAPTITRERLKRDDTSHSDNGRGRE